MKKSVFAILLLLLVCSCSNQQSSNVPNVIFETDMGNDVDDALALVLLLHYHDAGAINLNAVCCNKARYSASQYVHLVNCFYGHPEIPIGQVSGTPLTDNANPDYAGKVLAMQNPDGTRVFTCPELKNEDIPEAVSLYRKTLASLPDASTTIVSVGFSTNIARLLKSPADKYSPLTGMELVRQKVKLFSIMACDFKNSNHAEYNVEQNVPDAKFVFDNSPVPVVFTPYEVGTAIMYPATTIESGFNWAKANPVSEGYKHYLQMPYDRPTWDVIASLYAVDASEQYFSMSPWGKVNIDEQGRSTFTPCENGKHAYLTVNKEQIENTLRRLIETTTYQPAK